MELKAAVIGLAALGGVALGAGPAAAMPNGLPHADQVAGQTANVEQVRLVCNRFGRCWHRPGPRFARVWGPRRVWRRSYAFAPRPVWRPRPVWGGAYAWGPGPAVGWGPSPVVGLGWGPRPGWGWGGGWNSWGW